ncbi:hypothetical protein DNAM5_158 [Haloarcula californiae tailed virus 1]|uniref:Uncharacterized protein n=1 Tax=Haloarcula californiae tailed virus 1 TaxID=1273746 RepID=R4TAN7_9CAUD|nr:hypothetical protein M202_gp063 [Haloarcula californiae tailed virus 1]AGM12015.1 hypothetical protein DNAM5_158 [Haloarcula californiae tailed virus 1]
MSDEGWRREYGDTYLAAMWEKEWVAVVHSTRHEQFWRWFVDERC